MVSDPAFETLNQLRRVEATSLLPRMTEAVVFVAPDAAAGYAGIQRMIDEELEHRRWLDDAVLNGGGTLAPCRPDIRTADMHYVNWRILLPRLVADQEGLAAAYDAATPAVTGSVRAADVVARIAARHRSHAEQLRAMLADTRPASV